MKRRRLIFFLFFVLLVLVYTGGCRRAGLWLVKEDVPRHSDVMVILMGSFPERVLQAVDLYREGYADRVLIVEESMGGFSSLAERGVSIISNSMQARDACITLGIPADSIILLPGQARSTIDEALAVRRWLAGEGSADTLLIVSSADHMRRASMIFNSILGAAGMKIVTGTSPSRYSSFDARHWWRNREDIQAVASEYIKILSFRLFEGRRVQSGRFAR